MILWDFDKNVFLRAWDCTFSCNPMTELMKYPKVTKVKPLLDKKILVEFDNGEIKLYDCLLLLEDDRFCLLKDESIFTTVHVDPFGYGIVWNEDLDLAESELWINGNVAKTLDSPDPPSQNGCYR